MMIHLKGIPAVPGLAMGIALPWKNNPIQIPQFQPANLIIEKSRISEARAKAIQQLRILADQIAHQSGAVEAAILEAQIMFLEDSALLKIAEAEIDLGQNAEWAWSKATEYFAQKLENLPDETLQARAMDIRDIGRRVIEILLDAPSNRPIASQGIIVAHDLAPSQTASLDKSRVVAICTVEGGPTSHTAILAKALGIPAVVGLGKKLLDVNAGTLLLADGRKGDVYISPDQATLMEFQIQIEAEQEQIRLQADLAHKPAITNDGRHIKVGANVGNIDDARMAIASGAEGVGLLRTEFLFLNRTQAPDEQTQYVAYRSIFDLIGDRPIVVRTLDVGGDKEVPYYDFGVQSNPFLGYRAIRISLDYPDDFKTQLRALLHAGLGHDLRIMFPMIATLDEVRQAKKLVETARHELELQGKAVANAIAVGIMVEIPSVAILADQFAQEVDFFSIGTNDLTQYTLAAERGNKQVAQLSDPCHPSILREIQMVVEASRVHGTWVGVCGEMAGDEQAIPVLLGLGVDELSMAPALIPSAKQIIRAWSLIDARDLAYKAINLKSANEVRDLVDKYTAQHK